MIRPPPISPLFPYAPFSRSRRAARPVRAVPGDARLAPRRYLDGHLTGPHDALCAERAAVPPGEVAQHPGGGGASAPVVGDRKSTRLNSSHGYISYAVFCLKK